MYLKFYCREHYSLRNDRTIVEDEMHKKWLLIKI